MFIHIPTYNVFDKHPREVQLIKIFQFPSEAPHTSWSLSSFSSQIDPPVLKSGKFLLASFYVNYS